MLSTTQILKSSDSFFSYDPIRINRKQNKTKKSVTDLKTIHENKISKAETDLFNSRDLLNIKLDKIDKSITIIADKLAALDASQFTAYDMSLRSKLIDLKVKQIRLQTRLDFLNSNPDIIPFLFHNDHL
jgi:hypothetical protein